MSDNAHRNRAVPLTEDTALSVNKITLQKTKAQHLQQLRQQVQQSQQNKSNQTKS